MKNEESLKILVVAAHPDDEVLGCGGTIAKHGLSGDEVFCLILGEGVTSRYDQRGEQATEGIKQLRREVKQAAKVLGIKKVFVKDFPDNRLDTVPLLIIVKTVEEIKEAIKPNIVYTHHQGDLNIDHQITSKAVLTACRPQKGETVSEIYAFEVASSTEWGFPNPHNYFVPNVFVDVSETFGKKVKALKAYLSEIREYPHPRSIKALEAVAMRWGSCTGCEYAEAFELIRLIK